MPTLVDVRFESHRRLYRFNALELTVSKGDQVIVNRNGALTMGTVDATPFEVADNDVPAKAEKVVRVATKEDHERIKKNEQREKDAFRTCLDRIKERKLPMKLVQVKLLFDGSKGIFYFTADGRVDFRELVKDLAYRLRMRIEMMQIGVRDEAKLLCGYGVCGCPLCCSIWIDDFKPVSIRMAKTQNLSLNPSKVSGVCGRLMCCLSYEHENYKEAGKGMPKMGKRVMTPEGRGKVVRMDILRRNVWVMLEEGREIELGPEKIEPIHQQQQQKQKQQPQKQQQQRQQQKQKQQPQKQPQPPSDKPEPSE